MSLYLEIDIPQSLAEEPDQKAPPIGKCSTIIIASPHEITPPIRRGQHDHGGKESPISSNVGHIQSQVRELDFKKTKPSGHTYISISQAEGTPKLVDTSSQVSTLDDVEMAEASIEGSLPPSLP